jgi:hypothetical protein
MSDSTPTQLYPPFAVVTETDHTAWIIIATALGMSIVLLFSIIRAYLAVAFQPRFGLEEGCLSISTVCPENTPLIRLYTFCRGFLTDRKPLLPSSPLRLLINM